MNYGLMISCNVEEKLSLYDRPLDWSQADEAQAYEECLKEVLEENYGGEPLNGILPAYQRNQGRTIKRFTNAYMLVYIRESSIPEVLEPFSEEDTPAHLSKPPWLLYPHSPRLITGHIRTSLG